MVLKPFRFGLVAVCGLFPLFFFSASFFPLIAFERSSGVLQSLDDLRWKHRVLILLREGDESAFDLSEKERAGVEERHLVWFDLSEGGNSTNYQGKIASGFFGKLLRIGLFSDGSSKVVLIGKDGGIKARYVRLDWTEVFSLIDSMPMRIREMESQAGEP